MMLSSVVTMVDPGDYQCVCFEIMLDERCCKGGAGYEHCLGSGLLSYLGFAVRRLDKRRDLG
jgi:hypothetical protein